MILPLFSGCGDVVAEYEGSVHSKTYTLGDDLISQTIDMIDEKNSRGNGISHTETLTYFVNGQIKTKAEKLSPNGIDVQNALGGLHV